MARLVAERHDVVPILGDIFREHGVDGASLSVITAGTGLGKGSLYHFFPGGKAEMVEAVLDHVDTWFEDHVFAPLATLPPRAGVAHMLDAADRYFRSGRRLCLVGIVALHRSGEPFSVKIASYFARWSEALTGALKRGGLADEPARALGDDILVAIQGALVLARARGDPAIFGEVLARLRARMDEAIGRD